MSSESAPTLTQWDAAHLLELAADAVEGTLQGLEPADRVIHARAECGTNERVRRNVGFSSLPDAAL
jgi:hypothetical protein